MQTQKEATKSATLKIGDMACSGCADTVQKTLNNIEGVKEANVNLDDEAASVWYDSTRVSADDFKQAVENAGYEFKGREN